MSISAPFIARPIATSLLAVAVLLSAVLAYSYLPISSLPQVDFPVIQVTTQLPGANADTMARHGMANIVDDFVDAPDAALRAMQNGQEAHPSLPGEIRDAWRDRVIQMVDPPSLTMRGTKPVVSAFRSPLEMD